MSTPFAALHVPGEPFVLPNAWDVGSARALVAAGFRAIGTTSLGVAASRGIEDATRASRDASLAVTRELRDTLPEVLLTADLEDGFHDDPIAVADLVESLAVDGVNLEDATAGELVDPARHEARIRAVKDRCPDVFVNARTDVFWLDAGTVDDAIARVRRYVDAGADGVFVPGALDVATIEAITAAVDAPLNVLASATLDRHRLAELGVARISTGSLLYRSAMTRLVDAAVAVREGRPPGDAVSYDEVQAWSQTSSSS
ncbi:isocitrate lyase/PEP mutase family protein [Actinomycetospora termitidis]|uniref:Isocitrate lyase/phosphoenolpyruvate mutase family protein n=1 Tax=Actinomycetospora termitidis TaxID=3053470 RepID=A0ABT7MGF7_9PSEU|nr:isocitrate lyase/phosphoenolpyruvate mutase family protein [Actinomycetospora sp. Odt1-22]MDL5158428.1 isocitrate lyase/phosphoenolpyruvate mutase family protein [Actinomycetospora sp. Odt1-22]